ncbi:MAG TPA: response regulator [Longimicrobiales bacterium]|nr:response regulator [Longimicrobiales bacterium]
MLNTGAVPPTSVDPLERAGPARILVVDDEPSIAKMVDRRLRRDGHHCVLAGSGEEALQRLEHASFDLVVTDVFMPGMTGLELVGRLKSHDPTLQIIVMTAQTEVETAVEALRLNADDYLVKPFDLEQLAHSVARSIEHRRLLLENHDYRQDLEKRVRIQAERLEQFYLAGIRSLVTALEAKDARTRGHSDRVTYYAVEIGRGIDGIQLPSLAAGSQLHDIGKIGTRDDVLAKPGALTRAEREHIQQHPVIGVRILTPILDDPTALAIVRNHHERWEGGGYPDGIAGEEIPLAARIVAVADTLDAITSPRAYRPARSWEAALAEIAAGSGTQFDPVIADACLSRLAERPAGIAAPLDMKA